MGVDDEEKAFYQPRIDAAKEKLRTLRDEDFQFNMCEDIELLLPTNMLSSTKIAVWYCYI